ncbi:hypothetical protein BV22DRAFT_998573 [Leucogyrophana mollusca]|uniref:Uncharacterized protein n=1 Tax=Leucogyrophana mollusca TaxID=85980 RepID=A0ACB8BZY1_9AGAM|nr:hypothetical protein BV22DRAFT_998573 [Leucogyrophana mollusca]
MLEDHAPEYRPATPDSTFASSLYHATSTIDDLTLALTNFSRVPSPEPDRTLCCCCGSEECETTKSWLASKAKLESRLILSAEVGSALLQRHEAYSGHHTPRKLSESGRSDTSQEETIVLDPRVAELLKENALLEKRLTQALVNNEVSEASNKTTLHELEEARTAVTRLTAHHARAVGLDSRLTAVLQDNDDLRQERDSQTQRAKLAEARLAALKDRTDKLQAEVRRLQDDLETRRLQRLESSESLLQDVRSRLEGLQRSRADDATTTGDSEVMKVLESLVADNEVLKADNEELHKLLTESREDVQLLQTEVEEHRILPPPIRGKATSITPHTVETPHSRHSRTGSGPSSFIRDSLLTSTRRPPSVDSKSRRVFEPMTPETGRRPLSPADSLAVSETKYTSFSHPQPRYPPSHISFELDIDHELDGGPSQSTQPSKGVQTDRWLGLLSSAHHLAPSFGDQVSSSSHDGRSESSSLLDGQGSQLSALLERMASLLQRLSQADALTLTNRLKRQHLRGADVKHLSRTTVGNILSEIQQLRVQYRVLLEDEKLTILCTRKDLRGLFKFFKDVFDELGQLRVTLNDVILEPSIAGKVSEMALDPAKAEAMERERKSSGSAHGSSWMAPFSKLFGSSSSDVGSNSSNHTPPRPLSRGRGTVRQPRPVPKLGPALAASTTTVNVEFSGTGVGRSVTSTFSAHPGHERDTTITSSLSPASTLPQPSSSSNVKSVMGIFAGAPRVEDSDPWVVLPRGPRRVQSTFLKADPPNSGSATIGRSTMWKRPTSQLSRGVDAVIDADSLLGPVHGDEGEAADVPGPLLERTLRRRGLSDSSIHSTYKSQVDESDRTEESERWSERSSVLQSLSRTMQSFRLAASHTISGAANPAAPAPQRVPEQRLDVPQAQPIARASSPTFSSLLPNLTSWASAGAALESGTGTQPVHFGSFREESSILPRHWGRDSQGRDL